VYQAINQAVVHRAIAEIWNNGNLAVIEDHTHADYVGHMPGGEEIRGIEGLKEAIGNFREAFPNVTFKIESQIAKGDEVVTVMRMEGRQDGVLKTAKGEADVAATHRHVSVRGQTRQKFRDGKVVEEWVTWEQGPTEQIGAPHAKMAY
jgi:predicted ester cyclase